MRIFTAASKYVQGAGVLDQIGALSAGLGRHAFIVIDPAIAAALAPVITGSFTTAGAVASWRVFPGEVTLSAISTLAAQASASGADLIVGAGGGKALDTAKGVARQIDLPFVSVPTIASTDGPASSAIAVYDEHHVMTDVLLMRRNPDLVVVDTAVIVKAPLRFALAGIGDAIAKKFEAEACAAAGGTTMRGTLPTQAGLLAADNCYRLIRAHSTPALQAAAEGKVTEDVEALIEATVLLSTIGFENGGLSVAHAIARGLPYLPRAANAMHGEHVAYGLLVQLTLEHRPIEFMTDLLGFYSHIGLPRRLEHLGMTHPSDDEIDELADKSMLSPNIRRFPKVVTSASLAAAMRSVELL